MSLVKEFRRWSKEHPNFITNRIVKILQKGDFIVEISEGDFLGEKVYGVSRFKYDRQRKTFLVSINFHSKRIDKSFPNRIEAFTHARKLLKGIIE